MKFPPYKFNLHNSKIDFSEYIMVFVLQYTPYKKIKSLNLT